MKKFLLTVWAVWMFAGSYAQKFAYGTGTDLWGEPTQANYEEARQLGFEYLELAPSAYGSGSTHDAIVSSSQDMKRQVSESGMKVWSIHLPYGGSYDISNTDDAARRSTVERLCTYIKALAEVFSPRIFVLHPSAEPINDGEREEHIQQAIKSLPDLAEAAREAGATLAVENLPRTCLGNTPEELLRIVQTVPDVRITFDTNHFLKGTLEHFIRTVGPLIAHIHVSDYDFTDEKHWLPTYGKIGWGELMHELEEAGFDGVFMSEAEKTPDGKATIQEMKETYDQIFAEYEAMKVAPARLKGYLESIQKQFFADVPMDSVFAAGADPGYYDPVVYGRFRQAYEEAEALLQGTASDDACTAARREVSDAIESLWTAVNPLTDGYYWLVSGHSGFARNGKVMAMYTDVDNLLRWKAFEPSLNFLFKVTQLENGFYSIQNVATDAFVSRVEDNSEVVSMTAAHRTDQELLPYGKFGMFSIYNVENSTPYHTQSHAEGAGNEGNIINWNGYPGSGSSWYVRPVADDQLEALLAEKAEQVALNQEYESLRPKVDQDYREVNVMVPTEDVVLRSTQVSGNGLEKYSSYGNAVDGNLQTYFQSVCTGEGPDAPHYFQIDTRKKLEGFAFSMVPCLADGDQRPDRLTIMASQMGEEGTWKQVAQIDYGLPLALEDTLYTSRWIDFGGEVYRMFRFVVEHTMDDYGKAEGTVVDGFYPFRLAELSVHVGLELSPDCLGARSDMQAVSSELNEAFNRTETEYGQGGVSRTSLDALKAAYQAFLNQKKHVLTGISSPVTDDRDAMAPVDVYTLDGQLLRHGVKASEALRSLPAGVYVVGGKKVKVD